jgi:protein TonB
MVGVPHPYNLAKEIPMTGEAGLGTLLVTYVVKYGAPLLAYVVIRALTVRLVLRRMMQRAPVPFAGIPEDAVPVGDHPPEPRFIEASVANDVVLAGEADARFTRALKSGRRTLGIVFLAALAYAATMGVILKLAASPSFGAVIGVPVAISGGLAILILILDRYQHLRRVPVLAATGLGLYLAAASIGLSRVTKISPILALVPAVLAMALLVGWYARMQRARHLTGNVKLLILRVFNADRNTASVFGPLMQRWQYLGAFFTIVDPSYIRYQLSLSAAGARWKLLRVVTLVGVLAMLLSYATFLLPWIPKLSSSQWMKRWSELSGEQQSAIISLFLWLVLIPLAVLPVFFMVRRRFVSGGEALDSRIMSGARQRSWLRGVFVGAPLYCYDDVWKRAVRSLLRVSDVVLMDLRGFTPERRGCEHEIGELVDHFPANRTLFLIDSGETKGLVLALIRQRWARMSADSPNRRLPRQLIQAYVPTPFEDRDGPRILALLAASSATSEEPEAELLRLRPAKIRGRLATWNARIRMRRWMYALSEGLDMAIATPRYVRVVVPVLFLLIAGTLVWSLAPLAHEVRLAPVVIQRGTIAGTGVTYELKQNAVCGEGFYSGASVALYFTGGVAAKASAYGRATLDSIVDEKRNTVDGGFFRDPLDPEWISVSHGKGDGGDKGLENGFCAMITFEPPAQGFLRIPSVNGAVVVQVPDPSATVTIDHLESRLADKPIIERDELKRVGEFSARLETRYETENRDGQKIRTNNQLNVTLTDKGADLSEVQFFVGGAAKPIKPQFVIPEGDTTKYVYGVDPAQLKVARLKFSKVNSVKLPFTLKNLSLRKPTQREMIAKFASLDDEAKQNAASPGSGPTETSVPMQASIPQQVPEPPSPRSTPPAASTPAVQKPAAPIPSPSSPDRKVAVPVLLAGENRGHGEQEGPMKKGDLILAGPGVEEAQLSSMPPPTYPPSLADSGRYAKVVLEVLVDENGAVVEARVKSASVDAEFRQAALAAARQARFEPATKNGIAGKMWGELGYEFGTKK